MNIHEKMFWEIVTKVTHKKKQFLQKYIFYQIKFLLRVKNTINPLELLAEKHQFFNQNNQRLSNITYH